MFKVYQVKVHNFGIAKCLQHQKSVDKNEVGITIIIMTLMCSLKMLYVSVFWNHFLIKSQLRSYLNKK